MFWETNTNNIKHFYHFPNKNFHCSKFNLLNIVCTFLCIMQFLHLFQTVHSRMDHNICGRKPLKSSTWYGLFDHFNFSKAVFHKFFLIQSWIYWPIYHFVSFIIYFNYALLFDLYAIYKGVFGIQWKNYSGRFLLKQLMILIFHRVLTL